MSARNLAAPYSNSPGIHLMYAILVGRGAIEAALLTVGD